MDDAAELIRMLSKDLIRDRRFLTFFDYKACTCDAVDQRGELSVIDLVIFHDPLKVADAFDAIVMKVCVKPYLVFGPCISVLCAVVFSGARIGRRADKISAVVDERIDILHELAEVLRIIESKRARDDVELLI